MKRLLRQNGYGTGFLQVEVYGINQADPIDGVSVEITEIDHHNNKTILTTNEIGRTQTISLLAPDIINSMEPTMIRPYNRCNLKLTKKGYEDAYINGVQLFPEAHAHQIVYFKKKTDISIPSLINIEEPVLWGDFPEKIPEESVKELKNFSGLVVLPEVVIPEYIIVHMGTPNDTTVVNHRILFKDYIKNVACCEIFPSWPEETLKANVLAIISFTLNRVFTEWYRSLGHNFTITSTTSHDQKFDFGRTIYQEIDKVVDEVFTSYITKPNIKQPLLAQYCDGKRSLCPNWMSQWGSKYLGDQGKDALTILRTYYGSDVFLDDAPKVEGIPESFIKDLSLNDTGSEVRIIQEQLNAVSNNFPLIEKVKVNGTFDEQTRKSVEIFQGVFNLPVTGIVNRRTWYEISRLYVAVTKMAEIV